MNPANLSIQIDKLVLEGFSSLNRQQIGETIKRELERHFREQGVPASLSRNQSIGRIHSPKIEARPNVKGKTLGAQIAKAVHGGLKS